MTIQINEKLKFNNETYYGAFKIGFEDGGFVVDLFTTPTDKKHVGSFFTIIPISPLSYRKTNKTGTYYVDEKSHIFVASDWGKDHKIEAKRKYLELLIEELDKNEIPRLDEVK